MATDWETIESEYRAGQLSVNEIARQAELTPAAVRNRAKRYGWVRDLSEQVRQATRAKLLTDAVTPGVTPQRAGDTVEAAADRGASIVRLHRQDLATLRSQREALMSKFDEFMPLVSLPKDLTMMSGVLSDATAITSKLIRDERVAYNLDDAPPPDKQGDVSDAKSRLVERLSRAAGGSDTASA